METDELKPEGVELDVRRGRFDGEGPSDLR